MKDASNRNVFIVREFAEQIERSGFTPQMPDQNVRIYPDRR